MRAEPPPTEWQIFFNYSVASGEVRFLERRKISRRGGGGGGVEFNRFA